MKLSPLFSPRSIAVIGASARIGSVGNSLTANLLKNGYEGKVYPVNPKTDTLFSLPCYPTIGSIPSPLDLAIIIVPASLVPQMLREAGEKSVPAAIIISSGFKEMGKTGEALEQEVIAIARKFDIALLGPNCLGFLHPALGLNASFAKRMPTAGPIAFFSQSGALLTALLDLTAENLDFSYVISTGNKALIDENELLEFFAEDKDSRILSFYTEGITDSRRFIETGRAILAQDEAKPLIVLKSGTTDAGTEASRSHTGALAGSDAAYRALFAQARVLRATSFQDLLALLTVFSHNALPKGKRVAIVTNAGGLGVLATDAAIGHGLEIAKLSPTTEKTIRASLPPAASAHNPIDVLGDALADRYALAIDALALDPEVDMLLIIVTPQSMTQAKETARVIATAKKKYGKPLVAVFAGADSLTEGTSLLKQEAVATFLYPDEGVQALAALAQVADWRKNFSATPFSFSAGDVDQTKAAAVFAKVRETGRTMLSEIEAAEVLGAYGFPLLKTAFVKSGEEARAVALAIGKPCVMKIVSPDITHKSDVGGVLLSIAPEKAREAYEKLLAQVSAHAPEARLEGALIIEMVASDELGAREIILGMKKEPGLGNLLMVGLGGIYVETFQDVAFRFSPVTEEDANDMLKELRSFPLLAGARGKKSIDLPALIGYIGRLSKLVSDFPEIAELDINPLLVTENRDTFRVLDARIRLQ